MWASAVASSSIAPATIVSPAATTLRVPIRPASFAETGPPSTSPAAIGVTRRPASSAP